MYCISARETTTSTKRTGEAGQHSAMRPQQGFLFNFCSKQKNTPQNNDDIDDTYRFFSSL